MFFLKILSRFKTILDPLFEVGTCFCKGSFFLLAQDHLVNSFCFPNLGNKSTKLNWTLSWSSGLKMCSGFVFKEVLNRILDPLGKADKPETKARIIQSKQTS